MKFTSPIHLQGQIGETLPVAGSTWHTKTYLKLGGSGTADKYYICIRDDGGNYYWQLLSTTVDYINTIGYAGTTGAANVYAVTLDPAPTQLAEGLCVAVKIHTDNTGSSTININSLGAKPIRKANGDNLGAGDLLSGSIYTMRYNGTNFILQGEGGGNDGGGIPGISHFASGTGETDEYGFLEVDGLDFDPRFVMYMMDNGFYDSGMFIDGFGPIQEMAGVILSGGRSYGDENEWQIYDGGFIVNTLYYNTGARWIAIS